MTVALVGAACARKHTIDADRADWKEGDYYVTGGSGRVVAADGATLSIRYALEERLRALAAAASNATSSSSSSAAAAAAAAAAASSAAAGGGWLRLVVSDTDDVAAAVKAAEGADAVIACAGATATESVDRDHLYLAQGE